MRSAPPLTLRQTGPHAVHLVATAAGPLGGDRFELDLDVAAGTTLEVGSIASTLVLPGEGESLMVVTARVGPGATLVFTPEPTVLAAGCAHRMVVRLALKGDARVEWREEIIFGRYGEAAGRCHSRFDATLDGRALLRQEFVVGDPSIDASPAVFGDARCVGNILIVASPHTDGIETFAEGAQVPACGEWTEPGSRRPPTTERAEPGSRQSPIEKRTGPGNHRPPTTERAEPGSRQSPIEKRTELGNGRPPIEKRGEPGGPIVGDGVAVLPLAGPGILISALAQDAVELRQRLAWGQVQAESRLV